MESLSMKAEKSSHNEIQPSAEHLDLAAIVSLQATREEERKVLWKLDLL